jgi:Flp pilus assembly protein TadG
MSLIARRDSKRRRGQALVEFSLILIPFLFLLMGVVDLGRGIATYNGVAEAAREIARTTSLHRGSPL